MQGTYAVSERGEVRFVHPSAIDFGNGFDRDGSSRSRSEHRRIESLALGSRSLLGVVEAGKSKAVGARDAAWVQQDPCCHQGAGQAAATGLVGTTDIAGAERAVELEQRSGRGAG